MADELLENLENEGDNEKVSRIRKLSQKVEQTSKERDELAKAKEQAETEKAAAIRERDFYSSFSDSLSKYPNAKDHKDDIKTKVLAGYTVEDATVAVLAKAGKLNATQPEKETAAGGSATTNPPQTGPKTLSEMTKEEKRQAIIDADARGEIKFNQ